LDAEKEETMRRLRIQRQCPACGELVPTKLERRGTFFSPTTHCPQCHAQIAPDTLSGAMQAAAFVVMLAPMFFWQQFQESQSTTEEWLTLGLLGVGAAMFIGSRYLLRYVPVRRPV
jgi:hypothetical protein